MANELKLGGPLVIGSAASDPGTAFDGELYYNTSSNVIRQYINGGWTNVSAGSVSLTGQTLNANNIIVGDDSTNLSDAVNTSSSGDILADNSTGLTIKSGVITNSEVNSSAAIALTKLAPLSTNLVLQSNGSGFVSTSSVTSTTLSYLDATSSIQTQLNGKLSLSGGTMTGNINMGSDYITNLADPINPQDAATKNYVDVLSQSLTWKDAVRAATTSSLPSYTYNNGTSGVGATLTAVGNVALPAQDGVTLVVNDRLLVKNETSSNQPYNGIYVVTQVGSTGVSPYILTRSNDMDQSSEFFSAATQCGPEGSTLSGYGFRQNTPNSIIVGMTNISFINFNIGTSYSFNSGLSLSGNTVNVTPGDNSLLASSGSLEVQEDPAGAIVTGGSGIKVQLETSNPTLQINGSNQLAAKLNAAGAIVSSSGGLEVQLQSSNPSLSINSNQLGVNLNAAGAIVSSSTGIEVNLQSVNPSLSISSNQLGVNLNSTGAIVSSSTGIEVQVDNSTIDINGSNQIEVKSGGITNTQVGASAAIALTKLAALTANVVPVTNGSGILSSSSSSAVLLTSSSLQRAQSGSNYVQEQYVHSTTLTDNTSSPTSIAAFGFAWGTYAGEELTYIIETGAGTPDLRIGTLRVVSNGTNTSIVDTFTETADCGVTWSASISGSNTLVNYTTTNQGSSRTVRSDVKLFLK